MYSHRSRYSRSLSPPGGLPFHSDLPYSGGPHHGHHIASSPVDIALLIREASDYFRDGLSRRRSESWHRSLYGGMTDATKMIPLELGAAAGFEAWRRYNHRNGAVLDVDRERQMSSLVEMAVYEVDRWWNHGDRYRDEHGKKEALLAAAAIAIKFFHKGDRGHHRTDRYHSHNRLGSHSRYPDYSSDSDLWSSGSPMLDDPGYRGGRGGEFLHDVGRAGPLAGVGKFLHDRVSHRSDYGGLGEFGSPSIYGGRSEYGGYDDDYYRGRSLDRDGHMHHRGPSPGLLSTALPALETAHQFRRPRSLSRHGPSLEGLMGGLSLGSRHDYDHPSRDYYDDDYDYGRSHRHHHGGTSVIHTTSGDPTSEYGHLPPGTYVAEGGSSRHRHRSRSRPRLLL